MKKKTKLKQKTNKTNKEKKDKQNIKYQLTCLLGFCKLQTYYLTVAFVETSINARVANVGKLGEQPGQLL